MAEFSYTNSAATDFLNSTRGVDTTPYWNPANMEAKWGIKPPPPTTPTTSTGGNMPFPWMAAATVAAPIIGGLFGNRAAASQREGAREANAFQAQMQMDTALAGFGAQELARDNEYQRQLRRGIDTLGLMNSGPYIANMGREFGFQGALAGKSPETLARANAMFGGFA